MRPWGAVSLPRQLTGLAVAVVGLPLLTWWLSSVTNPDAITTNVLLYQLLVVVVALVGGIWPALIAALGAGILLDYFFVAPLYTVTIAAPQHILALVVSLVVAALVSFVVDQAARRLRAARESAFESEQLASAATAVLGGDDAIEALVRGLREAFGLASATLVAGQTTVFAEVPDATGDATADPHRETVVPVGASARLLLRGRPLTGPDRRILAAFSSQLEAALERRSLAAEAEQMRPIAAADRLRSALLSAVGHDLRRPLAAATAAVTSLRSPEVRLSESDRDELLATADESLQSLAALVTDLLDASRLQAGVLGVTLEDVAVDEVVGDALDEIAAETARVTLQVDPGLAVIADHALLKRVIVNLLANALRFSPAGTVPIIEARASADRVRMRVIDRGPGIPANRRAEVFLPFQRLGDTDNATGIGLGLALSKGFVEGMGGTLEAEDTPGGGLTMVIDLAGVSR
jgi:two-component system sensor histidine kinase KdpD